MTYKLYDEAPYEKEYDAIVTEINHQNDYYDIVLNQTLFFPEEGGQLCDRGTINHIPVEHVSISNGVIHHYLKEPVEGEVHGIINFDHRYDMMQNHSGEHIFSGIVHAMYGYENVGFHLGENEMTVDFDGYLSDEQLKEVELKVNGVILENLKINCFYISPGYHLNYRSKKELNEAIRIVEIEGVDRCACCAPHVTSTIEVGMFKVLKSMKYKAGVRAFLACGKRCYRDYSVKHDQSLIISNLLSLPPDHLVTGVERLLKENEDLKKQIVSLNHQMIDLECACLEKTKHYIVIKETLDQLTQRNYVNALFNKCEDYACVLTGTDVTHFILASHSDAREILSVLKEHFEVRGGGKKEMVQGTITAKPQEIKELLEKEYE